MEAPPGIAIAPATYRCPPARPILRSLAAIGLILFLSGAGVFAATYEWQPNPGPGTGDWNTATNWTPNGVPGVPASADTAEFATFGVTNVSLSADVSVGGTTFDASANAYTIDTGGNQLSFTGAGVINNSSTTQNFTTDTGGGISFSTSAAAGATAAYTNNGTGFIDISGLTNGGTSAGSIAGSGAVFLGGNSLTVGNLNTDTTFSGVIQDGGHNGNTDTGGQLVKAGTGTLTLSGANTYTGTTTINGGTLKVTGSLNNGGLADFQIGVTGSGTLSISGTGTVSNANGLVGQNGTTGVANVDGAGASWTNSQDLHVGDQGTGTVNVTNGGALSSADSFVGDSGPGTVTVKNAGSTWAINGDLQVGNGTAASGTLSISDGGVVTETNTFFGANIANGDNTVTGMVSVDGTGSKWTNDGDVTVGDGGTGTMSVTNGGLVSNANGTIGAGSSGSVTVDGTSSTWTNSADLVVSNGGTGSSGSLTIRNTGTVNAATTTIGNQGTVTDDATLNSPNGVTVMSGGLLKGTGLVTGNTVNDGTVSPGSASLGTLSITGTYQQNNDGTLDIAIGSGSPTLHNYDSLAITGSASLDGTLDVTLAGYTGHAGDVFEIVTSSALTGNFATIDLPTLSAGLFFTESTDADNVYLTVNQNITNVPEMPTWTGGLLVAGTLAVSLFRRVGLNARRSGS